MEKGVVLSSHAADFSRWSCLALGSTIVLDLPLLVDPDLQHGSPAQPG